ncbi:MAG: metal dependent phosphohydrolase [Firmicutes bacterium]|nr:metal dependent phosphohydrolase [Bacillota bacterium]
MNRKYGRMAVFSVILLVFTLVVDNFLTALVRSEQFKIVGYVILLIVLAALMAYAGYLKYALLLACKKIAIYNHAWQRLPCSFAVTGKDGKTEINGDRELFRLFGFSGGKTCYNVWTPEHGDFYGPATQKEICSLGNGKSRYAERFIIPVVGINGGYVVEFLFDASERILKAGQKEEDYLRIIKILVNMFEMKDPYSHGHSEVVSTLAHELARKIGAVEPEVNLITKAALLHDIGKITIPADVLNKTSKLLVEEYNKIKTHSGVGADILDSIEIFRDAAVIVRHHHERFDGCGYPDGLVGEAIPLGSRIIALADAFEAMTAGRSVNGKLDVAATLAVLVAEKGRQFDPVLVDVFVNMVLSERVERQ